MPNAKLLITSAIAAVTLAGLASPLNARRGDDEDRTKEDRCRRCDDHGSSGKEQRSANSGRDPENARHQGRGRGEGRGRGRGRGRSADDE